MRFSCLSDVNAIIILAIPIITFTLSIICIYTPNVFGVLKELQGSLNDYPLSNLEYLTECRNDHYLGSVYSFPGNVAGCTCTDVNYYPREQTGEHLVNIGRCDYNQSYNGCLDIKERKPQPLYNWYEGKFCSRKYHSEEEKIFIGNYMTLLSNSVLEKEECKEGYKKCGKLDNMGNYLCYPKDTECPINDIIFSYSIREDLHDYNLTKLNDTYIYYTNKAFNKPIITKLKAAEKKVCVDKSRYYTEYPQYILDPEFDNYGCKSKAVKSVYDDSIIVLDSINKERLYKDSDISIQKLYFPVDEFPVQSLSAEMILYSKNYVGYNKQCLKDNNLSFEKGEIFNEEDLESANSNIDTNDTAMKVIIGISVGVFILDIAALIVYFVNYDESFWLWVWNFMTILGYIGLIIPASIGMNCILKVKLIPECGDVPTNEKIEFYNKSSKTIYGYTLAILILVNGRLIFNIYSIIFQLLGLEKIFKKRDQIQENTYINNTPYQPPQIHPTNETQKRFGPEDPYYHSSDFNPQITNVPCNYIPPAQIVEIPSSAQSFYPNNVPPIYNYPNNLQPPAYFYYPTNPEQKDTTAPPPNPDP